MQATGQYNKVSQAGNYAANKPLELGIDNSPKRTYKGTLLVPDSSAQNGYAYNLAGDFSNPDGLPGITGTWGKLAAYSLWKQLNSVQREVRGNLVIREDNAPDMVACYLIEPASANAHVAGRKFVLLSYDWDSANAKVNNAVFAELLQLLPEGEQFESGYTND
ncbi:hypothetical protein LWM68_40990 [Niabella sp. W65]|nr:hypothetical protein [Niabella sp. W65]MCH7368550.1 hypothetical protein [Niabella sp. W65]